MSIITRFISFFKNVSVRYDCKIIVLESEFRDEMSLVWKRPSFLSVSTL